MVKLSKAKGLVVVTSVILAAASSMVASGATGDPFSHHHRDPEVTRTISITPSGGSGASAADLSFSDLLPGVAQTVTLNYRNSGSSTEDVYLVFPNATALSALNHLATFGQAHLSSSGSSALGDVFDSTNLSDNPTLCGSFAPTKCWPLGHEYEIARRLSPSSSGSFSFRFGFASAYSQQAPSGTTAYWNPYPTPGQTTVSSSDGSGAGLPYEIVATQPGITPGQIGVITQTNPFDDPQSAHDSHSSFNDQLEVTGASGEVTYVVTSPSSALVVSSTGHVTTTGQLGAGTYSVSGTDSDTSGDVGTWTFTLTVTGQTISCTEPDGSKSKRSESHHFEGKLRDCDSWGHPDYTTTRYNDHLKVSDQGAVTVVGTTLAPGNYTVGGTDRDAAGDTGNWSYTLSVTN